MNLLGIYAAATSELRENPHRIRGLVHPLDLNIPARIGGPDGDYDRVRGWWRSRRGGRRYESEQRQKCESEAKRDWEMNFHATLM